MTHEAGIWIFCIITLICLSVWLLCRRSKAVEDAVAPFHYEPHERVIGVGAQTWSYATPKDVGLPEKPKPLPKGWQGWEGSVLAPVQEGTRIVIMLRNGSIIESCGGWCNWVHHECGGDIVAWRAA